MFILDSLGAHMFMMAEMGVGNAFLYRHRAFCNQWYMDIQFCRISRRRSNCNTGIHEEYSFCITLKIPNTATSVMSGLRIL